MGALAIFTKFLQGQEMFFCRDLNGIDYTPHTDCHPPLDAFFSVAHFSAGTGVDAVIKAVVRLGLRAREERKEMLIKTEDLGKKMYVLNSSNGRRRLEGTSGQMVAEERNQKDLLSCCWGQMSIWLPARKPPPLLDVGLIGRIPSFEFL